MLLLRVERLGNQEGQSLEQRDKGKANHPEVLQGTMNQVVQMVHHQEMTGKMLVGTLVVLLLQGVHHEAEEVQEVHHTKEHNLHGGAQDKTNRAIHGGDVRKSQEVVQKEVHIHLVHQGTKAQEEELMLAAHTNGVVGHPLVHHIVRWGGCKTSWLHPDLHRHHQKLRDDDQLQGRC